MEERINSMGIKREGNTWTAWFVQSNLLETWLLWLVLAAFEHRKGCVYVFLVDSSVHSLPPRFWTTRTSTYTPMKTLHSLGLRIEIEKEFQWRWRKRWISHRSPQGACGLWWFFLFLFLPPPFVLADGLFL